jgi:hypothetical protein
MSLLFGGFHHVINQEKAALAAWTGVGHAGEEANEMSNRMRSWTAAIATAVALLGVPGAIVIFQAPGIAKADVCVGGGRRVSVSGCANIADTVASYVPPPAYYAPMPYDPPPPPNVSGCVSYNGRWVNASGCN